MSQRFSRSFSPVHHIPRYSLFFLRAVKTPLLVFIALVGNLVMLLGAAVFYHFEQVSNTMVSSFSDALWWALATISTVGYGDIVPVTLGGRITSALLIVIGVIFFISYTAIFTSVLIEMVNADSQSEIEELRERVVNLENSLRGKELD